jgi:uncharacterized protein (TIGR00661 family)
MLGLFCILTNLFNFNRQIYLIIYNFIQNLIKTLKKRKTILICPLDWGLGHATRCVPIINNLISSGAHVIIAADKRPLAFLKKEFPDLSVVNFPGYDITYQNKGSLALRMLLILPKILLGIYYEHKLLNKIIEEYSIDIVISDNRFGLWSKKVKTIFITHQILIKNPFNSVRIEKFFYTINKFFIKNFNECWIPDFEGDDNLSGDLSHKYKLPVKTFFIGPLSRFNGTIGATAIEETDLLVILSGPEPQRSIFEELVLKELSSNELKAIVVRGIPEDNSDKGKHIGNLSIYPHLPTEILQQLILNSRLILCRSGYSTVMDLAVLGKKAILIPTPGQTEQEYLATYFVSKKYFYSIPQKAFNLDAALLKSVDFNGVKFYNDYLTLKERIFYLLKE